MQQANSSDIEPEWLRNLQTKEPVKIHRKHESEQSQIIHDLKLGIRIVVISDTHGFHRHLKFPDKEENKEMILIHCGDMTDGTEEQMKEFNDWLGEIKHNFSNIVVICGNHETHISKYSKHEIQNKFLTNCTFLQDDCFEIGGLKAYASPWCPNMFSWLCEKFGKYLNQPERVQSLKSYDNMYYFKNEKDIEDMWNNIPSDVEILITHTPPKFILDLNEFGSNRGCEKLLCKLPTLPKLKMHLFGHIHQINGYEFIARKEVERLAFVQSSDTLACDQEEITQKGDHILFVNASNFHMYQPFYFDL
ncbi:hypothetical protein C9374_007425 [Naegleria lovaniensis]|uniref:Calcineurin-like phosphoesterase domain-containing protein n=1 Tax=Naegleria lovaniensis TaxID=51637 RepID=A0AA88KIK3_NAELO|nr:uncharacterized protein C9374_007425 [Naegleria lovaniensis]KAG2379286.1 hypothetical protein C9374_007425 [Naegleria lovaniensis]